MMREEKKCEDRVNLYSDHLVLPHTHKEPTQKGTNWLFVVSITALLAMALWNGYLTWSQRQLSHQVSLLRLNVKDMELLCTRTSISNYENDLDQFDSYDDDLDDDFESDNDLILTNPSSHEIEQDTILRVRRDATNEGGSGETRRNKKKKSNKKNKNKDKSGAAHFVAHVDPDRFQREQAEGLPTTAGNFTDYGLSPSGRIYNFWKEESWTSGRYFKHNHTSGKVTIKHDGLYLIYGQMMFHGPTARKSYGIHINDETVPFIESLSFDNIRATAAAASASTPREKRDVTSYDPDPYASSQSGGVDPYSEQSTNQHSARHSGRHRRSGYASYSQCNTIAVTQLKKGDQVFLKSLEFARSVIPKKYLTFWGLAKL